MRKLYILIFLFAIVNVVSGQNRLLTGTVKDSKTGEPVPFANVYVKGTTLGTITDTTGYFKLNFTGDSVSISAIGYFKQSIKAAKSKDDVIIDLEPEVVAINEVKVKPNDQQIRWIIKNAVEQKENNNPEKYNRYFYEKYSKWDYVLNNVEKSLMKSNVFKDHKHLFQKGENGNFYLPVYFSEQIVQNDFQRKPLKEKSTILADKTSGLGVLNSYEFSGYTSGLNVSHNFYQNYIKYYEQNFVSPLANNGWFYYRYYLVDSTMVNDIKNYKVLFYPKRKGENVFQGYMIIDNKRFAIQEIDAKLSGGNQLNFIKNMEVKSEYQLIDDSIVFFKSNHLSAEFDYLPISGDSTKQRLELLFTESSSFDKVVINPSDEIKLSVKNINYESVKSLDYRKRDEDYWDQYRHVKLSDDDLNKYAIIDSVNQIKTVKLANDLVEMGLNGYLDVGKFELGPYTDFIQSNEIEGYRFYFGGRTSSEISENWMLYGGLGYGTETKMLTGRGGVGYRFNHVKRKVLKLEYDDRYIRMGENRKILYLYENMLSPSETNLVSSILSREAFDELYRQQGVHMEYENEWRTGLSTRFNLDYMKQHSPEFYPFIMNGQEVDYIQAVEAGLNLRLSWKETVIDDGFMRLYVSTDYPIINFAANLGRVEYNNVSNWYGKVHATVNVKKYFGQTIFNYAVEAGKIFGKLPYTMLEIPRGNETYGYYRYDFNLINYLEFIHDQYVHTYVDYHLNGFFFNRLPLLKRLGFREVVSAKAMIGSLNEKQLGGIDMPAEARSADGTYLEVGAGVENVLRFFRVEGIWRVAPKSIQGAPDFGIRILFEVKL
ncbi:DUF5686 family protein [Plebeiibacterium sediminum]|uniref:DUF5686 and carboxypeptidase regulatory-like domain-containing protein n=1 Tax=Plebeiibacterium sediminum TaxID=2992112 RepID=A0AAE3M4P1_9BACT|nr:DUF5686 family protein [Plebeiobacterium sediminum]MCW3787064.1 DUF5686 and carboxypeptidase regulatory-like domain-containing protein [Plebeiobacterium sediminum]